MEKPQLECRIVITYLPGRMFSLGMFDPQGGRHEALGTHPLSKIDRIVRDLKVRMEREKHRVTFSEVTGPR